MKKIIRLSAITVFCVGLSTALFAQEESAIFPISAVSNEIKANLKTIETIAILLTGNDALLTRVVEDAFAIYLTNAGFTVINREMLEKTVGEQVAKKRKEEAEGVINALEIGIVVGADSILTGTIFIETGEQLSLLTKVASFQLVDVASGKTLINVLFESEKGNSLSETAKGFVGILRQNTE